MAVRPPSRDVTHRSATEMVRELRERNAPRRERVLRSIERLREIADAKDAKRRRRW